MDETLGEDAQKEDPSPWMTGGAVEAASGQMATAQVKRKLEVIDISGIKIQREQQPELCMITES